MDLLTTHALRPTPIQGPIRSKHAFKTYET